MTTEETTYKATFHLIDGTKLKCHQELTAQELMDTYRLLGEPKGRIKFPTSPHTQEFLPVSSILRVSAEGEFE